MTAWIRRWSVRRSRRRRERVSKAFASRFSVRRGRRQGPPSAESSCLVETTQKGTEQNCQVTGAATLWAAGCCVL